MLRPEELEVVRERAEARRSDARARTAPIVVKQEVTDPLVGAQAAAGGIPVRQPHHAPPPLEISPADSPMPAVFPPIGDEGDSDREFDARVQETLNQSRISSAVTRRLLQASRDGAGTSTSTSTATSSTQHGSDSF